MEMTEFEKEVTVRRVVHATNWIEERVIKESLKRVDYLEIGPL